jgi:hypothetical protein
MLVILRLREAEVGKAITHKVELLGEESNVHLGYVGEGGCLPRASAGERFWPTLERAMEDLITRSASWMAQHLASALKVGTWSWTPERSTGPFEMNGEEYRLAVLDTADYVVLARFKLDHGAKEGDTGHPDGSISIPRELADAVAFDILAMNQEV